MNKRGRSTFHASLLSEVGWHSFNRSFWTMDEAQKPKTITSNVPAASVTPAGGVSTTLSTCQMLASSETDAGRHAFFHRMHVVLNDAKLALHHTLDAAPAMVQQ
jgi:hypothetical protein